MCLCFVRIDVDKEGRILVGVVFGVKSDGDVVGGMESGEVVYMDIEVGV